MSMKPAGSIHKLGWALCLAWLPLWAQAQLPSVLVETASIREEMVAESLTAFGTLQTDPDQVLSVSLSHAGLIDRVWVRLGQRVESGDPLLEVITAPDAHMQYLQAKSAVDFAERELQRQQRLLKEQLATQAQVDAAKRALADAMTTFKALQQRGQGSEKQTLRAPMDGIVTRLDVSQGQRVQSDATVILIAAEKHLIARLGVEPEDLAGISPGSPVIVTSVFVPDIRIETQVREVHAMVDPATHLVEVLAGIPAARSDHLVLGTRVVGQIQLSSRKSLVVPRSAVLAEAGKSYVFVVTAGKARRVPVQAGVATADSIAVSGALTAGDRVVVSGNYELSDGMAIREKR